MTSLAYCTTSNQDSFIVVVKIDVFAAKNNMTEAVKVGKQFLSGIMLEGKVAGVYNGTESTSVAVPSHPLVERLQNIKVRNSAFCLGLRAFLRNHSVKDLPATALFLLHCR